MNKRTLLLLGAKGTGALALFGTGIGAYVLLSPNPKDINIKYWTQQESDSNIVKSNAITSSWTSVTHYPESKFFITCNKGSESDKGKTVGVDGEPSINGVTSGGVSAGAAAETGDPVPKNPSSPFTAGDCKKYIESKAHGGHPIWVYEDKNNSKLSSSSNGSWKTYKFTYQAEAGGETKDYFGLCFPLPTDKAEPIENPCSSDNLPKGWTKSLVSVT